MTLASKGMVPLRLGSSAAVSALVEIIENYRGRLLLVNVPGVFAEEASDNELKALGRAVRQGQVELVHGLFYEPESSSPLTTIIRNIDYSLAFWAPYGIPSGGRIWLPKEISQEVLNYVHQQNFTGALLHDGRNNTLVAGTLQLEEAEVIVASPQVYVDMFATSRATSASENAGVFIAELAADDCILVARGELGARASAKPPPGPALNTVAASQTAKLRRRLQDLEDTVAKLPAAVADSASFAANTKRLKTAIRYADKAACSRSFRPESTPAIVNPEFRRIIYSAIVSAQVEADTIQNSEVDPLTGWVLLEGATTSGGESWSAVVDTQLLRVYLRDGGISELDYKPRKLDLFGVAAREVESERPLFTPRHFITTAPDSDVVTTAFTQPAVPKVLRQAKDNLKFRTEYRASTSQLVLMKEFSFRAGIGAHLNNATTGFTIEYWLDAGVSKTSTEVLQTVIDLKLPSTSPTSLLFRKLTAVGGVSDDFLDLTETRFLDSTSVLGGLHGVRLIDAVENLVIDLRFAKQIAGMTVAPLPGFPGFGPEGNNLQGIRLTFSDPLSRISTLDRSQTLFVSIA